MQTDTALIKAVVSLFDELGLESSAVEHLEQFEEWVRALSVLEIAALLEFLSRRLARRFEEAK